MTTTPEDIAECQYCGAHWRIEGMTATRPRLASLDSRQYGNRCPFCGSNRVRVSKEPGTMEEV